MEDLGFLFKDPEPLIVFFLTMSLWYSKSMYFFLLDPMHLSQAALADECPLMLPRLTF